MEYTWSCWCNLCYPPPPPPPSTNKQKTPPESQNKHHSTVFARPPSKNPTNSARKWFFHNFPGATWPQPDLEASSALRRLLHAIKLPLATPAQVGRERGWQPDHYTRLCHSASCSSCEPPPPPHTHTHRPHHCRTSPQPTVSGPCGLKVRTIWT